MSWFGKHVKVASFDNRGGRLSVAEYEDKVKRGEDKNPKKGLIKEISKLLDGYKNELSGKGVDISHKQVVESIHIPEILIVSPLGNVTYFTYKEEAFTIWFDGEIM